MQFTSRFWSSYEFSGGGSKFTEYTCEIVEQAHHGQASGVTFQSSKQRFTCELDVEKSSSAGREEDKALPRSSSECL